MSINKKEIFAEECHKLLCLLRSFGEDENIKEIIEQIDMIQPEIWSKNFSRVSSVAIIEQIIHITKIIKMGEANLCIVYVSLEKLMKNGIAVNRETCDLVLMSIINQFSNQNTEYYSSKLFLHMLSCLSFLLEESSITIPSIMSVYNVFSFLLSISQQIPNNSPYVHVHFQLTMNLSLELFLNCKENYEYLKSAILSQLVHFASLFSSHSSMISRRVAFSCLHQIATMATDSMKNVLVSYSCYLLFQQLQGIDSKDVFLLCLRLFFNLLHMEMVVNIFPFFMGYEAILSYVKDDVSKPYRVEAFEIIVEFASQPSFIKFLFANFANRYLFPPLFEKFFSLLSQIAGLNSILPEMNNKALGIISTLIGQLNDLRQISQIQFDDPLDFDQEREEFSGYIKFKEDFEKNPANYLENRGFSQLDLAKLLFVVPDLSKEAIGVFFSKNNAFCIQTLYSYLDLFDFKNIGFDNSIRLFLSSFKIVGEAQVVDRIFDCFARHYYEKTQDPQFSSIESVHVLSYAWLMLHTSLYNNSITNKPSSNSFSQMLKGQNNGIDFSPHFIQYIFESVSHFPVVVESDIINSNPVLWVLLNQKQRVLHPKINDGKESGISVQLFEYIWKYSSNILSTIFLNSKTDFLSTLVSLEGTAKVAYVYRETHIIDNFLKTFCAFSISDINQEKSYRALQFVFKIVKEYGFCILEGWRSFSSLLFHLFKNDMLSLDLLSEEDICNEGKGLFFSYQMFNQKPECPNKPRSRAFSTIVPKNVDNVPRDFHSIVSIQNPGIIEQSKLYPLPIVTALLKSILDEIDTYIELIDANPSIICFGYHIICQIIVVNHTKITDQVSFVFDYLNSLINRTFRSRYHMNILPYLINSTFLLLNVLVGKPEFISSIINILVELSKIHSTIKSILTPVLYCCSFKLFLNQNMINTNNKELIEQICVLLQFYPQGGDQGLFELLLSLQSSSFSLQILNTLCYMLGCDNISNEFFFNISGQISLLSQTEIIELLKNSLLPSFMLAGLQKSECYISILFSTFELLRNDLSLVENEWITFLNHSSEIPNYIDRLSQFYQIIEGSGTPISVDLAKKTKMILYPDTIDETDNNINKSFSIKILVVTSVALIIGATSYFILKKAKKTNPTFTIK